MASWAVGHLAVSSSYLAVTQSGLGLLWSTADCHHRVELPLKMNVEQVVGSLRLWEGALQAWGVSSNAMDAITLEPVLHGQPQVVSFLS